MPTQLPTTPLQRPLTAIVLYDPGMGETLVKIIARVTGTPIIVAKDHIELAKEATQRNDLHCMY